jgi:hypothetical protein
LLHQRRSQGRSEIEESEAPPFILPFLSFLRRNPFKGLMPVLCWLLWNFVNYVLNLCCYHCYLLDMNFYAVMSISQLSSSYFVVLCVDMQNAQPQAPPPLPRDKLENISTFSFILIQG